MGLAGNQQAETPIRRVAVASLVGTMIEWYDYFVYGTASALVFARLFFPALGGSKGALASFATFAVGFFVRPLGAVFWGHFGDRIGRKSMLILTLLTMGVSTFLIGALPTAAAIGAWAPVLLVVLRVVQGFGVAGEWSGAVLLATESCPEGRRGFYGSFPQIGNAAGLMLATGGFALCSFVLRDQFLAWGWRIPFLVSAVLLGVGLYIRVRVLETPLFRQLQRQEHARIPILEVLREHPRKVLIGVGIRFFNDVQGYMIITFSVFYLTTQLRMPESTGTFGIALAAAIALFTVPLFGTLSDRIGRRPIFAASTILGLLFAFPFFWLLGSRTLALICLAYVVMYSLSNMANYSIQSSLLSELFPTRIRYSGTGFTYNLESIIGGALAPLLATAMVTAAGGAPWPAAVYLIVVALVTLAAIAAATETYRTSLAAGASPPTGVEGAALERPQA